MDFEGREQALVLFPGALGDMVCFEPAIRRLTERSCVTLYARGAAMEVASLFPGAPERRSIDGIEVARLFAPLEAGQAPREPWLEPFARIVSYTGARCDSFRHRLAATGRARVLPFPARTGSEHVIRELFAGATGVLPDNVPSSFLVPRLRVPASRTATARAAGRPLLAVHPGSGGRSKRAGTRVFEALVSRWQARVGGRVVVLLGPAEDGEQAAWDDHVDCVASPPGIVQLASMLADTDAYLGNDSGPSHVAAALGRPTIVLHVATRPGRFAAMGPRVSHVARRSCDDDAWIEAAWTALAGALP